MANKIDLGDDHFQEAVSVKPFKEVKENDEPLKVFEYLSRQKIAFDMGNRPLERLVPSI